MTEIAIAGEAVEVLVKSTDTDFTKWIDGMDVEELTDVGQVLTRFSGASAIRAGLTAYKIRTLTPDGQWGQEVFKLAERWEVSDRTIHRWMKQAQVHFELELTPAQKNAGAVGSADVPSSEESSQETVFDWDDEDDDAGFASLEGEDDTSSLTERMNAEAGWGDDTLPSSDYENKLAPPVTPKPMALPPDDTWVEFTARSIMQEHEGYSEQAAERSARARWARLLEEAPMDLLEDLETIHEAHGSTLPDASIEALLGAEEARSEEVLKPDEVTEGKKKTSRKQGPKLAYDLAEKLLVLSRQLHEEVYKGLKAGTKSDKEVAAMLPHLEGVPRTVNNLTKMAREAKERYLKENPPIEEKIAATQAAEADLPDFESEL